MDYYAAQMALAQETVKGLTVGKLDWLLKNCAPPERKTEFVSNLLAEGIVTPAQIQSIHESKRPPIMNSKVSSKPPSTDWKPNRTETAAKSDEQGKRESGAQPGHPGKNRPLSDSPNGTVHHWAEHCKSCNLAFGVPGSDGSLGEGVADWRLRKVSDYYTLAENPIICTQHRQMETQCSGCGDWTKAPSPPGLEGSPFAPELQAFAVYLKACHHFSFRRIVEIFHILGCIISEGAIIKMYDRVGKAAREKCELIHAELVKRDVIASDETGLRVGGKNAVQWVFRTFAEVLHLVEETRSGEVVDKVLDEESPKVYLADRYAAYRNRAEYHQTCLAHMHRKARLVHLHGDPLIGRELDEWCMDCFALSHDMAGLKKETVARKARQLSDRMAEILYQETDCEITRKGMTAFRNAFYDDQLLTFAKFPPGMVPVTNNDCERSLRHSVITRKVIHCFMSMWGAKHFAALRSVIETSALAGKNAMEALTALFK